jgi:hypothetical protein
MVAGVDIAAVPEAELGRRLEAVLARHEEQRVACGGGEGGARK